MNRTALATASSLILISGSSMAALIFSEDFNNTANWYNNKQIQWDADWIGIGNNNGAQANVIAAGNGNLDSMFSYRGGANKTGTGAIPVGQTVTFQLDYNWVLNSGTANNNGSMFGLTSNITSAGSNYTTVGLATSNTLGFQMQYNLYPGPADGQPTDDGTFKMLSAFNASNANSLLVNAEALGYSPRTLNDLTGDTVRLTYSATKTATADTWLVNLEMYNYVTAQTYTKTNVSVVNANAYNASTLYFAFQEISGGANATSTIDNISLSVIPEPSAALLGGLGMLALLRRRR